MIPALSLIIGLAWGFCAGVAFTHKANTQDTERQN